MEVGKGAGWGCDSCLPTGWGTRRRGRPLSLQAAAPSRFAPNCCRPCSDVTSRSGTRCPHGSGVPEPTLSSTKSCSASLRSRILRACHSRTDQCHCGSPPQHGVRALQPTLFPGLGRRHALPAPAGGAFGQPLIPVRSSGWGARAMPQAEQGLTWHPRRCGRPRRQSARAPSPAFWPPGTLRGQAGF